MVYPIFRRLLLVGMAAWLGVAIIGCGSKVSGKYSTSGGEMTIVFNSGQATLSDILGNTETADYSIDGKTVTIKTKDRGDLQFTLQDDGSLTGQGVTLKKSGS
jgi:hypothetical protein